MPEITFKELCSAVSELTKKSTHYADSVRKKCNAEKWAKSVRDYCRFVDASLDSVKCRLFEEFRKKILAITIR